MCEKRLGLLNFWALASWTSVEARVIAVWLEGIRAPKALPGFDVGDALALLQRVKTNILLGIQRGLDLFNRSGISIGDVKGEHPVLRP